MRWSVQRASLPAASTVSRCSCDLINAAPSEASPSHCLNCSCCRPEPGIRPHIRNISLVNVTGDGVWRAGWLNCLPESPCEDVTVNGVVAPGALPWVCEHVRGRGVASTSPDTKEEGRQGRGDGGRNVPSVGSCFTDNGAIAMATPR